MCSLNNQKFNRYLEEEFNPAQEFAHSAEGERFIRNMIPSLDVLRSKEDEVLAAAYIIKINGHVVYIGQSLRAVKRLFTHAHNIFRDSFTYFGIYLSEIESIEMEIATPPILDEKKRLACEESLVRSLDPVLEPYYKIPGMRYDTCLPRGQARRDAMIKAGVIKA